MGKFHLWHKRYYRIRFTFGSTEWSRLRPRTKVYLSLVRAQGNLVQVFCVKDVHIYKSRFLAFPKKKQERKLLTLFSYLRIYCREVLSLLTSNRAQKQLTSEQTIIIL